MKKKKILIIQQFFYPDLSAVSQLITKLLCEHIKISNFEYTVLCSTNYKARFDDKIKLNCIKIKRIVTPLTPKIPKIGVFLDILIYHFCVFGFILFKRKYDFVVSFTSPPLIGFTVGSAKLLRKFKHIHYIEDLYPELLLDSGIIKRSYIAKKLSLFNRITFRSAEKIIIICKHMKDKIYYNYGIVKNNFEIIENWPSIASFSEPKPIIKPTFLYTGNLGFAHEFKYFSKFIQNIIKFDSIIKFVASGRRTNSLKKDLLNRYPEQVFFSPPESIKQHAITLSSANFLIVAQSTETVGDIMPSKFYTYLAAGRPIIFFGTIQSDIGDYICRYNLGAVIEIEPDVEQAIRLISFLVKDQDAYLRTCNRINKIYHKIGGVNRAVRQFDKILRCT